TTMQFDTIQSNSGNGIRLSNGSDALVHTTTVSRNGQNGVQVDTQAVKTIITNSTIFSNTLKGVLVSDVGTQRAKIFDNSISGNLGGGIDLTPETSYPAASATNPNHDIDTPYAIRVNQVGQLTGKGRVDPASWASCWGCEVQIFKTNPQTLDGQGLTKITTVTSINPDGSFSATVGSPPPPQIALTATDNTGNTSEFIVFTRSYGL